MQLNFLKGTFMASNRTCIGFDVGRSAVKLVAVHGSKQKIEKTEGRPTRPRSRRLLVRITDDREAARAATETVSVDGRNHFVGETAVLQA